MTLYEFISLNNREQREAAEDGMYIGHREDDKYKIILYQIDAFYVEACFQKEKFVLKKLIPFSTTELLEPYLDQIEHPVWIK